MIKALETILDRVRHWPKERQDDAAAILAQMDAIGVAPYRLSPEERADLQQAIEEAKRGEIADPAEVAAFYRRVRG